MANFFIVVPTLNSAKFLECCLASIVMTQPGNFGLRVHVQDGGSTDNTNRIAESFIARGVTFTSEEDGGLYDAVNRAAGHVRPGEIMTWLGSDDILMPGTLATVASIFDQLAEVHWVSGLTCVGNEAGEGYTPWGPTTYIRSDVASGVHDGRSKSVIMQEGTFWRSELWQKVGGLRSLKRAGDWDLWRRFAQETDLYLVNFPLARFTRRAGQKSESTEFYYREIDASPPLTPVDPRSSCRLVRYPWTENWAIEKEDHPILVDPPAVLIPKIEAVPDRRSKIGLFQIIRGIRRRALRRCQAKTLS